MIHLRKPWLAIGLLSILALVFRVATLWDTVFPSPGEVRLLGGDPYYHLRYARFIACHFPHLQRWDVGTHYPNGQQSDATGLFDWSVAAASLVLGGGQPNDQIIDHVAAWIPAVLGTLAIPILY